MFVSGANEQHTEALSEFDDLEAVEVHDKEDSKTSILKEAEVVERNERQIDEGVGVKKCVNDC